MDPPSWAWADLPRRLAEIDEAPGHWPTRGDYAQRICAGVDTTRSQWRLRLLSSMGGAWAELALGCTNAELCSWLDRHAAQASGPLPPGLDTAVSICREDTPEPAALWFADEHGVDVIAWPRRTQVGIDHQGSLGHLAAELGLRRVAFQAVSPRRTDLPPYERRVALYAWSGGTRLRTLTFSGSDRSILTSHVGLINLILEQREAEDRLGVAIEDDVPVVVRAPLAWWREEAEATTIEWMVPLTYSGWDASAVALPDRYDTGFPINVEAPN